MAFDPVLVGTTANDGTGDPLRTAFTRVNSNFGLAVEGPATATSGRVAVYDGATGKLLQDGAKLEADLAVQNDLLPYNYAYLLGAQMQTGIFYNAPEGQLFSNVVGAEGLERGTVFVSQKTVTANRIAVLVNGSGTSGAVIRLGIREFNIALNRPGNLILDAGTVDATSTGMKIITISQSIVAGTYYVLTATVQGGAATRPTTFAATTLFGPLIGNDSGGTTFFSFAKTGVTGALDNAGSFQGSNNRNSVVYLGVF